MGKTLLFLVAVAAAAVACGGDAPQAERPEASATAAVDEGAPPAGEPAGEGGDPLHRSLVLTHQVIVKTCFGGFGKGTSYSAEITVKGGAVSDSKVTALDERYTQLPEDCMRERLRAMPIPSGTDTTTIKARFAVKNEDCDVPECPKDDATCVFRRDIACSVVIDSR